MNRAYQPPPRSGKLEVADQPFSSAGSSVEVAAANGNNVNTQNDPLKMFDAHILELIRNEVGVCLDCYEFTGVVI